MYKAPFETSNICNIEISQEIKSNITLLSPLYQTTFLYPGITEEFSTSYTVFKSSQFKRRKRSFRSNISCFKDEKVNRENRKWSSEMPE